MLFVTAHQSLSGARSFPRSFIKILSSGLVGRGVVRLTEQIEARNDVPTSPKERHQQLELFRPQADRESAPIDGVRTRTHFDLPEADALA